MRQGGLPLPDPSDPGGTVSVAGVETETGEEMSGRDAGDAVFGTRTRPGGLVVVERRRKSRDSGTVETVVSRVVGEALEAFVRDAVYELGEHARRGGTAYGAAVVLRRVGRGHGVPDSAGIPLPRPTRAERRRLVGEAGEEQFRGTCADEGETSSCLGGGPGSGFD